MDIAREQAGDVHVAREERKARLVRGLRGRRAQRGGGGERRELQRGLGLHRHVAHADVGAALRDHRESHPAIALDGHPDAHLLAVGLHRAEELVLVLDPGRELGRAQPGALG
ncbi:hypothetical protein D3C83_38290 [compost metagenome]